MRVRPPVYIENHKITDVSIHKKNKFTLFNKLTQCLFISIIIASFSSECAAAIKSRTGNIHFDSNRDNINEMTLSTDGLGIGTSTPAANVHVLGNAIISNNLTLGSTVNTSQSTLHINGTISYSLQSVGTGGNTITSSMLLADTSSGNVNLQLPAASTSVGQVIYIKRTSILNELSISAAGNLIDGKNIIQFMAGNLTTLQIINTNSGWQILSQNSNESFTEVGSSNLFLWWEFSESSGNSISDSSNNARGGNLTNELYFAGNTVAGPAGTAVYFETSAVSALYADSVAVSEYSYCLWTKMSHGSADTVIYETEIDGSSGFVWASTNTFFHKSAYHQQADTSYVSTQLTSELSADTWHHIAVSYDGSSISLYLDGKFESSNTVTGWTGASNIELSNPGSFVESKTYSDELRFYNKSLSADEVQQIFFTGVAP